MRKYNTIISILGLEILFSCCTALGFSKNKQLREIAKQSEDMSDFKDVTLTIVKDQPTNISHIYTAEGLYKGQIVGLKFELKNRMVAGLLSSGQINKDAFIKDGLRISSIGQESNMFIIAVSELYGFTTTKTFSKKIISSTVFSLNKKYADLDTKSEYKFKLFFEENSNSLYSELFFNIDLQNESIELAEKDKDYRDNIIKVMTQ